MTAALTRLRDAASNRAAEGLRVLEDIARFQLEKPVLARQAKVLRHAVRAQHSDQLVAARDTAGDGGRTPATTNPAPRDNLAALIRANANRAAEALRSLTEIAGLAGEEAWAARLEVTRFAVYDVEQALLQALPITRLWNEKLYVLIDTATCDDPLAVATASAAAGAGIIQLRGKNVSLSDYWHLAEQMQPLVRAHGALFIVNDHLAVTAALGADGVHLGQNDAPPALARAALGPSALIGMSCHSLADLQRAQQDNVDYVGLGPMYATSTKAHEPARGPELLAAVREELRLPSYAIGGINLQRARTLAPQLPHGFAVASAVGAADDPATATKALLAILGETAEKPSAIEHD